MSESSDLISAPRDREVALSVAYLRVIGSTQVDAAKAAGVDPRTVGRWESCSWWPEIVAEASRRWLSGLEARARQVLYDGMDPILALKVLERRLPELAPATQNLNLHTPDLPARIILETRGPEPEPEPDE